MKFGMCIRIIIPYGLRFTFFRNSNFFHKNLFAMAQDLEFFSQTTILYYGAGLRIFFFIFFFRYGSVRT